LESRFGELREGKIEHVFGLSRFVMRRLQPAVKTCRSTLERLTSLFERINRTSGLLRTSIELSVQEHNQRLLESSDHRAWLQLRLQDAFQILSVVVIGYYTLGLLGYPLRALRKIGLGPDPEIAMALRCCRFWRWSGRCCAKSGGAFRIAPSNPVAPCPARDAEAGVSATLAPCNSKNDTLAEHLARQL
jgi:hypothetical protein